MALIAAMMLAASCARDIQNKEAVRQGVVDYLTARQAQTGLNVTLMDVEVGSLTFSDGGAVAHAGVLFRPKQGDGGMQMSYTLDRKSGKWVVRGHAEGPGHGDNAMPPLPELPPNHPPVDKKP